ncbi:BRE1 E3 ubiquitin ligase-domain-containing protein [Podospora aff. communis PSN243]|uniref:E3 ubiquitin protein ligase n=1 Tax=Podospora aff. communis PSN243 TaxID=3040156 RepID=A0AAV9H7H9_9PEZI|nr:BRE1 E3 ubiquitin ligase-domain-containing protein [Podospora aff. communis PSN243]
MPIATSPSLPHPATFKMEDRKRPASNAVDDGAPPSKRQAVNASSKNKDDSGDTKEEIWIEEYQKGAIYRQMLEYKREKSALETKLQDLEKKSVDHDDHIRVIDAWVLQLLQEIELLVTGDAKTSSYPEPISKSALSFKDSKDFQRHLGDKAKVLTSTVNKLFERLHHTRGEVKPEVAQLESQVKALLATQKELTVKLDRLETENSSLSEQLDTATLKVVKAERKLDRTRSAQVQKLEQQALAGASTRTAAADGNGTPMSLTNGDSEELKMQYQEAVAAMAKQKEQLETAMSELKALQEENSTFKAKKESITDEDYARTEVFKQFKLQNEDLIKRINHLQATNKELREDAERLRAERTAYRVQLESEAQTVTLELEEQIAQKDQDLTRIRSARDELTAELAMRKAAESAEKTAITQMKELVEAKVDRIAELETELERLRPSEDATMSDPRPDLEALSTEELREKYVKLEKDFEAINKELPLLEKSYKKAMGLAHKKVMDFSALEQRVAILTAEKAKADQKYFAARKDTDIRTAEIRTLRAQNGKSSEIISQLKEMETQNRMLIASFEKQIADMKQSNSSVMAENKKLEAAHTDLSKRVEALKAQISELSSLVKSKDSSSAAMKEKMMDCETELEKLKARVKGLTKDRDSWKTKCQNNSSDEEETLRNMVICSICRTNFKNTMLKGCGHAFCSDCVDSRLANRMRKCPACNKAFDRSDAMPCHL